MFDPTFFVALSFFVFLAVAYKPLGRFIANALDGRAARIEGELAEAIRLRDEAQLMLGEYEKKHHEIEKQAKAILKQAKESARQMQEDASAKLEHAIAARLNAANEKIARAEEHAVQDVQRQLVDMALKAAKDIIAEGMQQQADDRLITLATKDISRIIH